MSTERAAVNSAIRAIGMKTYLCNKRFWKKGKRKKSDEPPFF